MALFKNISPQFSQSFFDGIIGDVIKVAFIVNGEEVDGGVSDLDEGDNSGAAGIYFSFGGNGEAYFVAIVAVFGTGGVTKKLLKAVVVKVNLGAEYAIKQICEGEKEK